LKPRVALLRSAAVVRFRVWFAAVVLFSVLLGTVLRAQVSDEERRKREEFLKTREEAATPPQKSPSLSPKPKPKAKKTPAEATPKPKSTKKKSATKKGGTAKKKKTTKSKKSTEPEETPKAAKSISPRASETPGVPETPAAPRALAVPTAPPTPTATISAGALPEEPAQLTIEKTGYEKRSGFWYRLFHGGGRDSRSGGYRYLTRSVRAEIDRAPADRRNPQWQMIVVHNSGTRQGNARVFDYYHRRVRHMKNGLAYHFVIGNGTSTGNGEIEVGDRWRRQINGGHVHSDNLNNIALGICLVGDFNRDQPTRAQLESCEELIRYLRQRCGKVGNRYMIVRPHRDVNPPRWGTDCPGDAFPYSWFRRFQ
jgi:hypothetical protein